jgi:hypothetical protein
VCRLLALVVIASAPAVAADVVYLHGSIPDNHLQDQVMAASRVLGLTFQSHEVVTRDTSRLRALLDRERPLALVLEAKVLALVEAGTSGELPVLVGGISPSTDPKALSSWSRGEVLGALPTAVNATSLEITRETHIVGPLAGAKLPLIEAPPTFLKIRAADTPWLLAASTAEVILPTLLAPRNIGRFSMFAAESSSGKPSTGVSPYRQTAFFTWMAAPLIFLRHVAGAHSWHTPVQQANLTIDDVWLRRTYGHVDHQALLQQMEASDFHTTLAFVPWNFDRSDAATAQLYREHPDRFSICVHGNNHEHREFGPYQSNPLARQDRDLQQALARMAKFELLTRVPFDRVMVFPHAIAPTATLALLKKYGYEATANSTNVPLDAQAPEDPEFAMRAVTTRYAAMPSLRRYSVESEIPEAQLRIDAFLGNPMLFYAHESFFVEGPHAFNRIAKLVNRIAPGTEWRSLGDIARSLYLQKRRRDGDYDVKALSANIRLRNPEDRDVRFYVEKYEMASEPVEVRIDGQVVTGITQNDSQMRFVVSVPARRTVEVSVISGPNLDISKIDTQKDSLRTASIRYASDFRDILLSRTSSGRWFIASFARNSALWKAGLFSALVVFFLVFAAARLSRPRLRLKARATSA